MIARIVIMGEGYSESLDHEVRAFGIRVLLIEPGVTRSAFETSAVPPDAPMTTYDGLRAKYGAAFRPAMAAADSAESVAQTIVLAARDRKPQLRYPSGRMARQGAMARRFLPRSLFDKMLHKQFGLN